MAYEPVYGPCFKVVIVKAFPYRAEPLEEFSNDYTFAPVNMPANDTQWNSIIAYMASVEQSIYPSTTKWHRAYAYNNNDPKTAHTFLKDWQAEGSPLSGLYVPTATDVRGAGDQASVVQWLHSNRTATGKPLYYRKYNHDPFLVAGGGDNLAADYVAALQLYGDTFQQYLGGPYSTKYPTGTSVRASVLPYVTTRTLKRRGKRPRPAA